MTVDCFLDTNILVYAVSALQEDAKKKATSLDLVRTADFGISTQVLQEFYATVTRKIQRPLEPEKAVTLLEAYRLFPTAHTDHALILTGIEHSLRHGISYWDGAIIAAAEALGATVLYTDDLSHGQRYGSVQAINPYLM